MTRKMPQSSNLPTFVLQYHCICYPIIIAITLLLDYFFIFKIFTSQKVKMLLTPLDAAICTDFPNQVSIHLILHHIHNNIQVDF